MWRSRSLRWVIAFFEEIAPQAELLPFAEHGLLALALVDQPILPFALAVAAERRVQGMVGAGEPGGSC